MRTLPLLLATLSLLTLLGCGQDDKASAKDAAAGSDVQDSGGNGGADANADSAADAGGGLPAVDPDPDCDPLQPGRCSLPWPSSKYLVADDKMPNGVRLAFGPKSLPKNYVDVPIDPKRFAHYDGYSLGTAIVVQFPGVDIAGMADEDNLAPSLQADAKIALLDLGPAKGPIAAKPTAVPYWVELDQHGYSDDEQGLLIRPGVIFKEGHRYAVAIRGLKDKAGKAFAASPAFAALRDDKTAGTFLAARKARFEEVFGAIAAAGWKRDELLLAWDFVTASDATLHGDLLHVRDKAFEIAGGLGADVTVTAIETFTKEKDPHMALWVSGEMTVPDFTESFEVGSRLGPAQEKGKFGMRLRRGADGKPMAQGTRKAKWWAVVPHTALDGTPHGIVQYGHGLLGLGDQVKGSFNRKIAFDGKLIFFACNWTGMSEPEEAPISQMILDFSDFYMIPEGLHQGMAEALLLGRAMRERFSGLEQIKTRGVVVDKSRFCYSGISQGGIYGGTYMALSQDVTRGHLGVPGINYSLLLHRSVDFAPFLAIMSVAYPSALDRQLVLMASQLLWDPVDPQSHFAHMAQSPYKDTPKHEVLLVSAKGDWQVALKSNEVLARSGVGVALMKDYGKKVWGVDEKAYPHKGSALVNFDFGNPWPKPGNVPDETVVPGKTCGPGKACLATGLCSKDAGGDACDLKDPHGKPRRLDNHNDQMLHFFATGEVKDVCGGDACTPL